MGSEKTGPHTEQKQSDYAAILAMHTKMVQGMMQRHAWIAPVYHYFDMNAGSGIIQGEDGSPIIFAKQARELQLRVHGLLFEKCPESVVNLRRNMEQYQSLCSRFSIVEGDHTNTMRHLLPYYEARARQCYGLMYFDPNGNIPPFDLIRDVCAVKSLANLDILINLAATTVKRARMAFPDRFEELETTLATLGKKQVLVRRPLHRHQWTFLLLTNWADFPQMERRGFYRLDTPHGREAMLRISKTAKELENEFTGVLPL